jgi:hypothetical protein
MTTNLQAQINMNDSTVQVIGYWDKNEKQSYIVTHESYRLKGTDTTTRDFTKYGVDITITDSTADSYTIDWFYHDFDIKSDNELLQKISVIAQDMTITFKTNELGVFQEVLNWKEVRDYIFKGLKMFQKETKEIPNMDKYIRQVEKMYNSKESIEAAAIKEIQQFHTYHGGKYAFDNEINASMKTGNLYGDEPFDTDLILWVEEIDPEDNSSIICMEQTVNSEQLTKTTFDYLTEMATTLKTPAPVWSEFPALKNVTWTTSRIHGSGWVIYSIETKEVSTEEDIYVEECIIEIQ